MRDYIKTIGLYRNKAKNVIALSEKLIAEFGGEVPRTRAEIESLPGAGRKTANVVLNMAFGEHTMAVDTHVFRVGNRTGLAPGKTPLEVELGLGARDPAGVHAARASLADPARPLHLSGAQAALRGMPDQRSLPLAGKDGLRHHPVISGRHRPRCGSLPVSPRGQHDVEKGGILEPTGSDQPGSRGSDWIDRVLTRRSCGGRCANVSAAARFGQRLGPPRAAVDRRAGRVRIYRAGDAALG